MYLKPFVNIRYKFEMIAGPRKKFIQVPDVHSRSQAGGYTVESKTASWLNGCIIFFFLLNGDLTAITVIKLELKKLHVLSRCMMDNEMLA